MVQWVWQQVGEQTMTKLTLVDLGERRKLEIGVVKCFRKVTDISAKEISDERILQIFREVLKRKEFNT
jgi:hypothetical protein